MQPAATNNEGNPTVQPGEHLHTRFEFYTYSYGTGFTASSTAEEYPQRKSNMTRLFKYAVASAILGQEIGEQEGQQTLECWDAIEASFRYTDWFN